MRQVPVLWILLLMPLGSARAQGTIYFSANLTGDYYQLGGTGTFSLTTNYFAYDVVVPYGFFNAQIQSAPGSNGPVLFTLHSSHCDPPINGDPGACYFIWQRSLSDQEAADLQAGMWYVYVTLQASPPNPPFFLQGQILPTPEPPAFLILAVGIAATCFFRCLKVRSL